jgi:hypothetical protein
MKKFFDRLIDNPLAGFVVACMIFFGGMMIWNHVTANHVSQSYWYCWNTGAPSPHHLGYHVNGDHLCTDAELHQ